MVDATQSPVLLFPLHFSPHTNVSPPFSPFVLLNQPNVANPSKQLGDIGRTAKGRKNMFSRQLTNDTAEPSILSKMEKNTGFRVIFYISFPQCKCLNVWISTLRIVARMAIAENSEGWSPSFAHERSPVWGTLLLL